MKSRIKAFPYPVLGKGDDYLESEFQATIEVRKDEDTTLSNIILEYSFLLSNDVISHLISEKKATFAIDVACPSTLFRKVFNVENYGNIKINEGDLYGKVSITPLVVSTSQIHEYTSNDLNEEFDNNSFTLYPGDILAIDDEQIKYIEFNTLKFESLVQVETISEMQKDTYRFDLSEDTIKIQMGTEFRQLWNACREREEYAPVLAMSVFKDCIHAALDFMIKNEDASDLKWFKALSLKIPSTGRHLPAESDFNETGLISQILISKYGMKRMLKNVE